MNTEKYTTLLETILIPFTESLEDDNFICQHDNVAVHTSKHTKQWFHEKNIKVLTRPACSPDMTPIENVWGIVERKVYSNCKQFNTITELGEAVNEAWASVETEYASRILISAMPNHIFNVT